MRIQSSDIEVYMELAADLISQVCKKKQNKKQSLVVWISTSDQIGATESHCDVIEVIRYSRELLWGLLCSLHSSNTKGPLLQPVSRPYLRKALAHRHLMVTSG